MPYTSDAENLNSARSLSPRMELHPAHKRDVSPVRPFRARPLDLDSRWSVDFHSSPYRRRDGNLSPYSSMDNLFGSVVGAAWPSGFKLTRDALKRPPATAIKLTYFSIKERVNHKDGKDVAMLTLQSAQKLNRNTSIASPSPCGSSTNSRRSMQRSPGRKWVYEAGVVTHEEQLRDIIKGLENCRKGWENDGNYVQASIVAKQIQALKIFLENKKRTTMTETHARETEAAEAAYKAELSEKNRLWSERFKVFQSEVIEHAQFLKQQHLLALQNFKTKMDTRTPKKPQLSRELLNERKVQTFLGKQGKYLEAQRVKKHADCKEVKELQATLAAYQAEVGLKEQALRAKQRTEMGILLQRAAQTRDELRKNKEQNLTCCAQRHKNIIRDLDALHKQEQLKHDHKMQKIVREFRALGGELRDLTHAMETLIVPALTELGGVEESASSILEVQCLNIGGLQS
ncbi:hypothetical protein GOP47_0001492 [Adiantum capillus-veneris]|uniref:Uncharacterized protein n=1 Tax=Adiantum capillus-veneris TaxID=13818 RepID=A0A9D4V8G5_ADICA|nr:hypothetical protein GOP47_0001492 [Adiantum capillus-veneris]